MNSESTWSTQKALREYLKSTQRAREQSDLVIPSEPKILRLVIRKLQSLDDKLTLNIKIKKIIIIHSDHC